MNNLLIFFAFPIAVIIISVILEKLIESPFTVAALIFAIFIVITFAAFDETFLIATLAYTILAFLVALLTQLICRWNNTSKNNNSVCECLNNILNNQNQENSNNENNSISDILNTNANNTNSSNCGCNRFRRLNIN